MTGPDAPEKSERHARGLSSALSPARRTEEGVPASENAYEQGKVPSTQIEPHPKTIADLYKARWRIELFFSGSSRI